MFVKYFRCIIIFHTFSYLIRYKHIIFIKFIICYNCFQITPDILLGIILFILNSYHTIHNHGYIDYTYYLY